MQVKKYEARTMKEALEMVKKELGPDAVILSARDNKKGFGIAGEGSVEITAAVSELTLRKKQFAESKLVEKDRQKFQSQPARQQKELIDKMVNSQIEKTKPRPVTAQRYIEIDAAAPQPNISATPTATASLTVQSQQEITQLHSEIMVLKKMITQFQNVPQNVNNPHLFKTNELYSMYTKLCDEGMNPLDAQGLVQKAQDSLPTNRLQDRSMIEGWIARAIMDQSLIATDGFDKKIHVFWGPPGVGKTTTLVKMAAQLMKKQNKRIALVTMDTLKVGATEQLKIYAQILNTPFAVLRTHEDWKNILMQLDSVDHVFVDSPGPAIQLRKEADYCQKILGGRTAVERHHLVLSAAYPKDKMFDLINRSEVFNCDDLMVTHLDERQNFGGIYSLMLELALPLHSFGLGNRMPDDFEMATKERVLDLLFHITRKNNDEFMRG
jgi:flagellar biosynthesis protein FlhF